MLVCADSHFCNFTHEPLTWTFSVLSIFFFPWLMNALQVLPQTPLISRKFSQHYNDSEMFPPHVLTCYSSSRQQKDDKKKKPTCIHRQVQGIWFKRHQMFQNFEFIFPSWLLFFSIEGHWKKLNIRSIIRVLLKSAFKTGLDSPVRRCFDFTCIFFVCNSSKGPTAKTSVTFCSLHRNRDLPREPRLRSFCGAPAH